MVVASENDLTSKRGFPGNVDSPIVVEHPFLSGYPSIVGEGGGDADIP